MQSWWHDIAVTDEVNITYADQSSIDGIFSIYISVTKYYCRTHQDDTRIFYNPNLFFPEECNII